MFFKSRRSSFAPVVGFCLWMTALGTAQTVQGTGAVNNVPMITATSSSPATTTIGNSPISVSGSNVGIGTANPGAKLHISAPSLGEQSGPNNAYIGSHCCPVNSETVDYK